MKTAIIRELRQQIINELSIINLTLDSPEELEEIFENGDEHDGILIYSTDKHGHFLEEYRVVQVNKEELYCVGVGETEGKRTFNLPELTTDELCSLYDSIVEQTKANDNAYAEMLNKLMSYEPYTPENAEDEEKPLIWSDFLEEANGNIEYALSLRERVDWEHPSTLVEQDKSAGEYKSIYLLEIEGDILPKELLLVESEDALAEKKEELIANDPERKNGQYGVYVHHTGEIEVEDI